MAATDEIQALMTAYGDAYNRRDAAALTALYTEDGAIYSHFGPAALGRQAIDATHREWLRAEEENKRFAIRNLKCGSDMAVCVAGYAADHRQEDGRMATESGVSVNVILRRPEGWKIHISSLTPDSA